MPNRLWVFRTATAEPREAVSGWQIQTVVLGEQFEIPGACAELESKLPGHDCFVVTSPRAARWLCSQKLSRSSRLPIFVSGAATGAPLASAGWDVRTPDSTGGEAAVRLLVKQGFKRPLLVGAAQTAGTVEATCTQLGVPLSHLAVYATAARTDFNLAELPPPNSVRKVAFLAPSAVELLRELAPRFVELLAPRCAATAAGAPTRQALESLGWRDIRSAAGPTLLQLVQSFGDSMVSQDLFARAQAVIPGGVHSPVRAFRNVGAEPFYVKSAQAATLTTVDGVQLLDWVGSWGPMILGHNHPAVAAAIRASLESGTSFGACSVPEVELSEEICRRNPGIEKVRLVSSGTEATMSALRLARGFTGKPAFVKFRGCYHGHADSFLVAAGSGALTHGTPSSPGVTTGTCKDTLIAEFNNLDSVAEALNSRNGDVACVFVEPIAGNMGLVPPDPGFLLGLRQLCDQHGALLVLDEVMTGFRVGAAGAAGLLNIRPDLACYGKIIGGGLPLAAFGGRADIMDKLSPLGPIYQAGTLSGNPLACAAGLAMLRELTSEVYERLEVLGSRLETAVVAAIAGKPLRFQRVGSMATLFFHAGPVRTFADVDTCDQAAYGRFFRSMLARGHFLPPAQFEAFFLSNAHTEADIDKLATDMIAAALEALK